MTKHLHNLLTATGILMLCLFAALPARAYTALDLITGSEKICGVEAVHGKLRTAFAYSLVAWHYSCREQRQHQSDYSVWRFRGHGKYCFQYC